MGSCTGSCGEAAWVAGRASVACSPPLLSLRLLQRAPPVPTCEAQPGDRDRLGVFNLSRTRASASDFPSTDGILLGRLDAFAFLRQQPVVEGGEGAADALV